MMQNQLEETKSEFDLYAGIPEPRLNQLEETKRVCYCQIAGEYQSSRNQLEETKRTYGSYL